MKTLDWGLGVPLHREREDCLKTGTGQKACIVTSLQHTRMCVFAQFERMSVGKHCVCAVMHFDMSEWVLHSMRILIPYQLLTSCWVRHDSFLCLLVRWILVRELVGTILGLYRMSFWISRLVQKPNIHLRKAGHLHNDISVKQHVLLFLSHEKLL